MSYNHSDCLDDDDPEFDDDDDGDEGARDEDDVEYYEEADDYFGDPDFADPGGRSALRAATPSNPRNLPCPTCGCENRLTPKDRDLGYQCDSCADADEGFGY